MANTSTNLSLIKELEKVKSRLKSPEQMLGKGLDQPFSPTNSGARKILYGTQKEHVVPLINSEPAYLQTGYENRYGDESSSIILVPNDAEVVGIISKFSFIPQENYYVITRDKGTSNYRMYHRYSYEHTTETHGYLYNNSVIDSLSVGDNINVGTKIRSSMSYDDAGNRRDGINLTTIYQSLLHNTEDSVLIFTHTQEKMATMSIKCVSTPFNDNDLPLDLYDDGNYKSWPDIGEDIKNGILCGIRRENSEDRYYTQSHNKLKSLLMSDQKLTVSGTVVDINIRINNPLLLDNIHNTQFKKYYQEQMRVAAEFVILIEQIVANDPYAKLEYKLDEMFNKSKKLLAGTQYINDDKVFSNAMIDFYIMEKEFLEQGDKMADRYGGKGVVSIVLPSWMAPYNEFGELVDCIQNFATSTNRENMGQHFELSVNHINRCIVYYLATTHTEAEEGIDMIAKFLDYVSPDKAEYLRQTAKTYDYDKLNYFYQSILSAGMIYVSAKPITDVMTLDKLEALYNEFPWIKQSKLYVPMLDSNGNPRVVESRRRCISSKKYFYRLKQHSKDKFSSTSLSATNIKNQNTRSKSSKNYKAIHSNTPIAIGTMEVDDLSHIGMEHVITMLMIHSVSPQARRLCEQMLTGDPFAVNIQLTDDCSNRSVEILNCYFKAKGIYLDFSKVPKNQSDLVKMNVENRNKYATPLVRFIKEGEYYNAQEDFERRKKLAELPTPIVSQNLVNFNDK